MEEIFNTIKDWPQEPAPKNLSKKINNKILILKLRPYLYSFTAIMFANFIWLFARIYQYLVRSDALGVIKVMIQDFDLSSDYIANSLAGLKEILPLYHLSLLTLNFILIIYLTTLFLNYRHELLLKD